MKQTITYSLLLLAAIAVSFGFSALDEKGKVHLKVTKEDNGEKSVFKKIYANMEALKSDEELKNFDKLVENWTSDDNRVFIHKNHEGGDIHKEVIIKKKNDGADEFTWVSDGGEEIHDGEKYIIIKKKDDSDEVIEIEGEKIIEIKTDGEEKVFTITSEGDGDHTMVWIDEDGNKTELTEENIEKLSKNGEDIEIHKKIKVITSDDKDGEKNVIIMKSDGEEVIKIEGDKVIEIKTDDKEKVYTVTSERNDEDEMEIEVQVEKEVDAEGNEVIKEKKVWVIKDGEKVELDDENSFEFKTEGDKITIKIDNETIDIADFAGGEMEGANVMVFKSKDEEEEESGTKQTMNINVEEKDGEKFIEIDIKRNSALNVTISEIVKDDASLKSLKADIKNNLKPAELNYYPNPNNGKFNLKFKLDRQDELTVKVIDILGNEVYKEKLLDFNGIYDNEINLTGKQKGIYILQISQKKKTFTRKILIE